MTKKLLYTYAMAKTLYEKGRDYIGEVIKRLKQIGFKNIIRDNDSSSISAEE